VVTDRQLRGHLFGHPIYRAVDFDILPLDPGVSVSKPSHPVETHLLALVRSHLSGGQFLYSYELDITRRLQAQYIAKENDEDKPMWEIVCVALSWGTFFFSTLVSGRRQVLLEQVRLGGWRIQVSSPLFPAGFYIRGSWTYPSQTSKTM
jgi:hypothetical protein